MKEVVEHSVLLEVVVEYDKVDQQSILLCPEVLTLKLETMEEPGSKRCTESPVVGMDGTMPGELMVEDDVVQTVQVEVGYEVVPP